MQNSYITIDLEKELHRVNVLFDMEDYSMAVTKCRSIVEQFVNALCKKYWICTMVDEGKFLELSKKIRCLADKHCISIEDEANAHIVRNSGNEGIHEGKASRSDAQRCIASARDFAKEAEKLLQQPDKPLAFPFQTERQQCQSYERPRPVSTGASRSSSAACRVTEQPRHTVPAPVSAPASRPVAYFVPPTKAPEQPDPLERIAQSWRDRGTAFVAFWVFLCAAVFVGIVMWVMICSDHSEQDAAYFQGVSLMKNGQYVEAIEALQPISDYRDSAELILQSQQQSYDHAVALHDAGDLREAAETLEELGDFANSKALLEEWRQELDAGSLTVMPCVSRSDAICTGIPSGDSYMETTGGARVWEYICMRQDGFDESGSISYKLDGAYTQLLVTASMIQGQDELGGCTLYVDEEARGPYQSEELRDGTRYYFDISGCDVLTIRFTSPNYGVFGNAGIVLSDLQLQ